MSGVLEYPRVSVIIRGNPVMIENAPFHRLFTDAQSRGLNIDVWAVEPWATVYEGHDAGDAPEAWVYRWQTIPPIVIRPGDVLDVSNGPLYLRLQNPGRDLTATHVGNGEYFLCLMPDGSSYQVGGVESNGAFLRGFARGATIWAVVVAAVVVTAGAVSDYGLASSVAASPATASVAAPVAVVESVASVTVPATVVESVPAFVGPLETVSSGWTLASVTSGAQTVAAATKTAVSVIAGAKAAVSAITNTGATATPSPAPTTNPADNSMLLIVGAVSLLLFMG